jgi:hypothetical protein
MRLFSRDFLSKCKALTGSLNETFFKKKRLLFYRRLLSICHPVSSLKETFV